MGWREYLARFGPEPDEPEATSHWRDEYEERAAIYEWEAYLPRKEAERRAFEDAVTAWLFQAGVSGTIAERRRAAVIALLAAGVREPAP